MKRFCIAVALFACTASVRAQIPVIDAAGLAQTIATLAELRNQVQLILEQVELAKATKASAEAHLRQYRKSLTKRGVVASQSLDAVLNHLRAAERIPGSVHWSDPGLLQTTYPLFEQSADPTALDRSTARSTMATLVSTIASLKAHNESVTDAHHELARFKREINRSQEPQQMRDVQASLQIVQAREALLIRQALMTLANLESVRAAEIVSRQAQAQVRYQTLIGGTDWLGDPSRYSVARFMRMPGEPAAKQ